MNSSYPWYQSVDEGVPLSQGDFIQDCTIVIPPSGIIQKSVQDTNELPRVKFIKYNVIVMSHSCDIAWGKVSYVVVCPILPYAEFLKQNPSYRGESLDEKLRRGHVIGYHLLNRCVVPGFESDGYVVNFRKVLSISFDTIQSLVKAGGPRLRLMPPYRERLSQAFAFSFMRVGLDESLDAG